MSHVASQAGPGHELPFANDRYGAAESQRCRLDLQPMQALAVFKRLELMREQLWKDLARHAPSLSQKQPPIQRTSEPS